MKKENVISEKKNRFSFIHHHNICGQLLLSCLVYYLPRCLLFWIDSLRKSNFFHLLSSIALNISWIKFPGLWQADQMSSSMLVNYYFIRYYENVPILYFHLLNIPISSLSYIHAKNIKYVKHNSNLFSFLCSQLAIQYNILIWFDIVGIYYLIIGDFIVCVWFGIKKFIRKQCKNKMK